MSHQPTPEPLIPDDPIERFIQWFVDLTFDDVLKELESDDIKQAS